MEARAMTDFRTRCEILGDIVRYHKEDPNFKNYIEYNDIGLPLAYLIFMNVVELWSIEGEQAVNQSFEMLLESFELEDTGFSSLVDILPENF
jgi:hypothetical protein